MESMGPGFEVEILNITFGSGSKFLETAEASVSEEGVGS